MSPNQAVFQAGSERVDQIFTVGRTQDLHHGYQQPTVVCFIDFAAAFDSIPCESPWRIMELDGLPTKIIAMIKTSMTQTLREFSSISIFPNCSIIGLVFDKIVFYRQFC
ncbi:unnamed protein product [Dibothriocephalus latus]|uniref:Reverse transcriptase domain-containing protein n=1 Tax=Dibothriocephalus latus TaxID=60516 RepID=A0A3P6PLD6_DIBLA|nr:unnamed protein product [Dibothriocephalus latus]